MAPFPGEPNKGEVTRYDDIFDATKVNFNLNVLKLKIFKRKAPEMTTQHECTT